MTNDMIQPLLMIGLALWVVGVIALGSIGYSLYKALGHIANVLTEVYGHKEKVNEFIAGIDTRYWRK